MYNDQRIRDRMYMICHQMLTPRIFKSVDRIWMEVDWRSSDAVSLCSLAAVDHMSKSQFKTLSSETPIQKITPKPLNPRRKSHWNFSHHFFFPEIQTGYRHHNLVASHRGHIPSKSQQMPKTTVAPLVLYHNFALCYIPLYHHHDVLGDYRISSSLWL